MDQEELWVQWELVAQKVLSGLQGLKEKRATPAAKDPEVCLGHEVNLANQHLPLKCLSRRPTLSQQTNTRQWRSSVQQEEIHNHKLIGEKSVEHWTVRGYKPTLLDD